MCQFTKDICAKASYPPTAIIYNSEFTHVVKNSREPTARSYGIADFVSDEPNAIRELFTAAMLIAIATKPATASGQ